MSIATDVLNLVLYDIAEDPPIGPLLGIVTLQQLLDLLNLTLQDWHQRTGYCALVQTQYIQAGTAQYTCPDIMMRVDHAFAGGVLLEPTTVDLLTDGSRGWRSASDLPTRWHGDQLPLKTIELVANPNQNGVTMSGAQNGWNVLLSSVTYTPPQHGDLTLIGPQLPAPVVASSDPLCFGSTGSPTAYVPQDLVLGYLASGLLARLFSGDNELQDVARAQWCQENYEEGVTLVGAITNEASGLGQ